ncbi:addiction module protein [Aeoliella sp.]|uniref:addiction module protein n=1 Tax=Aeoliella sp. TaxID=2795800 RepID=UPI003CCC0536
MSISLDQLLSLPAAEKLAIVEALWDNLSESGEPLVLSPEQSAEIGRRATEMTADPTIGISREEMWKRVDAHNG